MGVDISVVVIDGNGNSRELHHFRSQPFIETLLSFNGSGYLGWNDIDGLDYKIRRDAEPYLKREYLAFISKARNAIVANKRIYYVISK
jgi:hypothetical protein